LGILAKNPPRLFEWKNKMRKQSLEIYTHQTTKSRETYRECSSVYVSTDTTETIETVKTIETIWPKGNGTERNSPDQQ
jgi:hypothetical protein